MRSRAIVHNLHFIVVLCSLQCAQLDRETLLSGNFGNADKNPPELISPNDNYKTGNTSLTLVWSAKAGASQYTVEIARDASFSDPLPGTPLKTASTSVTVAFNDSHTYFWRVRANTTDSGLYSAARRVHILLSGIMVHCREATTCSNQDKYGTKNFPYQIINSILAEAKLFSVPVRVARRGPANEPYSEAINLIQGVNLEGGYDPQTWIKTGERTKISGTQNELVIGSNIKNVQTRFESFDVNKSGSGRAFFIRNSDSNLVLRDLYITSNSTAGIDLDAASPVIADNTIDASDGAYAITASNGGGATIENNVLRGGSAGIVINCCGGSPIIRRNSIFGGVGATTTYAVRIDNADSPALHNNIIYASSTDVAYGLHTNSQVYVSNNVVLVSAITSAYAIWINNSNIYLRNNIIEVSRATNRYVFFENSNVSPQAIENNNVYGGGLNFYANYVGSGGNCPSDATRNCFTTNTDLNSTANTTAILSQGNISIDNTANQLFVKAPKSYDATRDGPDGLSTYNGTTTTIEVANCTDGRYVVGEYLEYNRDSVARQITAVNCTGSASIITFSPALTAVSVRNKEIFLWGSTGTALAINYRLNTANATICNAVYGGKNLTADFNIDADLITRTANTAGLPCTLTAPTDTLGQGWSMGAYERD